MTTTVERTYRVDAPPEDVWELIADPALRASAISVVDRYERDGDEMIWHLRLPIRAIPGTIAVRTRDVERDPPRFVRFVGTSRVMSVEGEHEISRDDDGSVVRNRFRVNGKFPGVESFFERQIDDEIRGMIEQVAHQLSIETDD